MLSEVTNPLAASVHRASSTSDGRRRVRLIRSAWKQAPRVDRISRISAPAPFRLSTLSGAGSNSQSRDSRRDRVMLEARVRGAARGLEPMPDVALFAREKRPQTTSPPVQRRSSNSGAVVGNAARQQLRFPRGGGGLEPLEPVDDVQQSALAGGFPTRGRVLPLEQETQERRLRNGFDLSPQTAHGGAVDASEDAAVAEFLLLNARAETAAQDQPLVFQPDYGGIDVGHRQAEQPRHLAGG